MSYNDIMTIFCQEPEDGNLEYKLSLNNLSKKNGFSKERLFADS